MLWKLTIQPEYILSNDWWCNGGRNLWEAYGGEKYGEKRTLYLPERDRTKFLKKANKIKNRFASPRNKPFEMDNMKKVRGHIHQITFQGERHTNLWREGFCVETWTDTTPRDFEKTDRKVERRYNTNSIRHKVLNRRKIKYKKPQGLRSKTIHFEYYTL